MTSSHSIPPPLPPPHTPNPPVLGSCCGQTPWKCCASSCEIGWGKNEERCCIQVSVPDSTCMAPTRRGRQQVTLTPHPFPHCARPSRKARCSSCVHGTPFRPPDAAGEAAAAAATGDGPPSSSLPAGSALARFALVACKHKCSLP